MAAKTTFIATAIITTLTLGYTLGIPEWAFLPPLAQGLSGDNREAKIAYEARVSREFPIGMPENDLTDRLHKEGFKENPSLHPFRYVLYDKRLSYIISGLPCAKEYAVSWSSKDERIVRVKGEYTLSCL